MNCQNCEYSELFEGNDESCQGGKRDDFGHDSDDVEDEECKLGTKKGTFEVNSASESESDSENEEGEGDGEQHHLEPIDNERGSESNSTEKSESESESEEGEGEGEQHHLEPVDNERGSESNSTEIKIDNDATRKKKTEEWMKLVEGVKAKRRVLQTELDLQNVPWCKNDTVEKLVARLVDAEMGQTNIREQRQKRDPLGKYFDQEAQVRDTADDDENDEEDGEYIYRSPGNSQDKDFVAGVTTSDSPSQIVYVCPVTGKGLRGEQRAPKSSRFEKINKAIRKWKMECTNEALSSQREDVIFSLRQIKMSIRESLHMNLIDEISANQLKAKVAEGRCR